MLQPLAQTTKLQPGEAMARRQRNLNYLMKLTPDNLLRSHYLEAGLLNMNWKPEGIHWGWDAPTSEIRGTLVGHWLHAAAHLIREQDAPELRARVVHVVNEIARCQERNGGRWAFPIPEKYLFLLRDGQGTWAPQYVCHKNMMGLLEVYKLLGVRQALDIVLKCADWFYDFTDTISRDTMSDMMDKQETGGILEFWADLYAVTSDPKHLTLMRRYERPRLADGLLNGVDMITNMHANSVIPEIHGYARAWEVTGEQRYRDVVDAFWKLAVTDRGWFATGGQTSGEIWTPPMHLSGRLGDRNQEHCVVFNMMRLADYLYRWTGDTRYADYWERNLWNGIFAQGYVLDGRTVIYYLPMNPGAKKVWGSDLDDFWCCHCTLLQANAQLNECIYHQDGGRLVVSQYLPSEVTFNLAGAKGTLTMQDDPRTGFPMADSQDNRDTPDRPRFQSWKLKLAMDKPAAFALQLRMPDWMAGPMQLLVDGEPAEFATENGYAVLERTWHQQTVTVVIPKALTCVLLPDDPDMVAFLDGPVCLAGLVGEERLLYGDKEHPEGSLLTPDDERAWQQWKTGWKTWHQPVGIRFRPLYEIADEVYTLYFPVRKG